MTLDAAYWRVGLVAPESPRRVETERGKKRQRKKTNGQDAREGKKLGLEPAGAFPTVSIDGSIVPRAIKGASRFFAILYKSS